MKPTGNWVRRTDVRIGADAGCKSTGSKHRGILYHRRVYSALRSARADHFSDWTLLVEPWYKNLAYEKGRLYRSPDAVLLYPPERTAIVIEVKLNWKDGRDIKLIDEYLPIVKQAEGLEVVWPLLITRCLRGWQGNPLLGFDQIPLCQAWQPGDQTPLMLVP